MAEPSFKLFQEPTKIQELTVPAEEGQLSRVRDFVVSVCESAGFSSRETNNTKLAVDEACTNIIKHAYAKKEGDIKLQAEISSGRIQFRIIDQGEHFDFAGIKDPDLDQYVESGRKGGLGVFLINRLMDKVEYRTVPDGNELILSKKGKAAVSGLPGAVSWRNSLRFKFTLRASLGLFLLITAIGTFIFNRQTNSIESQKNMQWIEKKRLAASLANRSRDVLVQPEAFSVEQTNLSAYLSKLLAMDNSLAYVRVLDLAKSIVSSGRVDEIFTTYSPPPGVVLLRENNGVVWSRQSGDQPIRDIYYPVVMISTESGGSVPLGGVHVGVFENIVNGSVSDPRPSTLLLIIGIFLLGILLIMGLVSVFVKPIQVLTDGVRAIGEGTLDSQIPVSGPAEIGAIAAVFNEITTKFKKAQDSILEQEKMHKEMEVAKQIQHSLLPKRMPDVSGYDIAPYYQAAAEVGGDYYDFVQVDENTVGIVVADVSGKGVPGSLVMTMIRTALRMEARGNKNASDVMSKMNDFVTDDMRKGMFVTMFYVILDSKNRIVSYASAGHNPMILYRRESNETYFLNPKGFPVGISLPDEALFRKSISLEKIKLKKDDMLLIYTDGVTEAMNERRDQYGEERLLNLIKTEGHLPPKEFIKKLEADIKAFTGGFAQNDDITVVAIKEKLAADDVLSGLRKKLIDLVEVEGRSVKEACEMMKVSPTTFYRYKKRLEQLGERGLKDKVLREELDLKRVSLEQRKQILEIIRQHPEYGAKRITMEFNAGKSEKQQLAERLVYDELKRLNLNTKELRLDYLRRNRLLKEEPAVEPARRPDAELVEKFLAEVSAEGAAAPAAEESVGPAPVIELPAAGEVEFETIGDLGISISRTGDNATLLQVDGHLDSVTSASLEKKIKDVISSGYLNIIVDLSEVSYISSGGWGIFTGEVRRLRESGGDVVLVGMTSEVYDVYDLLGFADVLKAFPDVEGANAYFRLSPEERLAKPAAAGAGTERPKPAGAVEEYGEEIPGESYVPEWVSLKIEATTVGDQADMAVLSLVGIIDTVSSENLRRALDQVIAKGLYKIVVDMSQVEYVSSGGWGTFTERLREVRRAGGDLKLFGMDPDVYYVFTMLGFNIVLSSFDILPEAIDDFAREPGKPVIMPGSAEESGPSRAGPAGAAVGEGPAPSIDLSPKPSRPGAGGHRAASTPPGAERPEPAGRTGREIVTWEAGGDQVLVANLNGSIEASAVAILEEEIEEHLADEPAVLIFDLERVKYISSTGWGLFAKCIELCSGWGGVIVISSMNEDLYQIYSYLEFQALIPVFNTKRDALERVDEILSQEASPAAGGRVVSAAEPPGETAEPAGVDEVESVDDILKGPLPKEGEAKAADPGRSSSGGVAHWPAGPTPRPDRARPPEWPVESEPSEKPAPAKSEAGPEQPAPEIAPPRKPEVTFTTETHEVDVQSAVSDRHIKDDTKIRNLGWENYGRKLRKIGESDKNKEDEPE